MVSAPDPRSSAPPNSRDFLDQHQLLDRLTGGDLRKSTIGHLGDYFRSLTGRRFERFDDGGDRPEVADLITAADVIAVSLLSIQWKPATVLTLLEQRSAQLSGILADIPRTAAIHEVDWAVLGPHGPADRAWNVLRSIDDVGPTTASKVLARKRPHLIPIYDSVVNSVLRPPARRLWATMWSWFASNPDRVARTTDLRAEVGGIDDISLLRCLDVAMWCHGDRGTARRFPA